MEHSVFKRLTNTNAKHQRKYQSRTNLHEKIVSLFSNKWDTVSLIDQLYLPNKEQLQKQQSKLIED